MRIIIQQVIIGGAMVLLMGCVAPDVRKGASVLAAFTQQVSEEGTEFVRSRTALAKSRQANIAMLEISATQMENSVNQKLAIWELSGEAGKRRLELMQGIQSFANNVAMRNRELVDLRERQEASIAAAKSSVELRQTDLAKVSKALALLSQDADFKKDIKFYVNYFQEVRAGIETSKEAANQKMKDAEAGAKDLVPIVKPVKLN